jgi:hypothetical protein
MGKKGKQKKVVQKTFKKSAAYLRKGAKSPDKTK